MVKGWLQPLSVVLQMGERLCYSMIVGFGAFCVVSAPAFAEEIPTKYTETKKVVDGGSGPNLPQNLQEIYPLLHQNQLLVAGGLAVSTQGELTISDSVWALSIPNATGARQWQQHSTLPEPSHHGMLVTTQTQLFLFGGFKASDFGGWYNRSDVLLFDASHGQWRKHTTMPIALSETVSAYHNNRVHLASGRTLIGQANGQWQNHIDTNAHLIYDITSNSWHNGEPIPTSRNSACSVVIGNSWHVIGGRTVNGGNLATHEVYDFTNATWGSLPDMPQAQGGLACAVMQGEIWVFGGEFFDNGGGVYDDVWVFNVINETWYHAGVMREPRHGLGAVTVGNEIWVVGGAAEVGARKTANTVSIVNRK